jgi:hypothetical protein
MKRKSGARPHGQIRQSQIVTTFGPGAMLDLPNHSVLVAGLDYWTSGGEEIAEPRLVEKLKQVLGVPVLKLISPPPDQEDPTAPQTGITVWQFPEWFITQDVVTGSESASEARSRRLVRRQALTRGKFIDDDKKKRAVVPIRFVRACRLGHIGDIEWYEFVHAGKTECKRPLWIDEYGTSGDLAEIWVRCECGARRSLSQASRLENHSLGQCDGSRPWLGRYTNESCGEPNRLLIRTASNAYFAQKMSVISLPDRNAVVSEAVDQVWQNFLEYVETMEELAEERRRKPPVKNALDGLTDAEVFDEIKIRRSGGSAIAKTVKQAELETLVASKDEIGEDRPDGSFFARALPRGKWDQPWMAPIQRVVLVHRLREVVALAGFTRFEAAAADAQGELEMGVRRASLAREVTWLPTVENRGEGVFLLFATDAIDAWLSRSTVAQRGASLQAGFDEWRKEHQGSRRQFPGLPFILLHSFSHLLLTSVSLECGYPASSIRERIYALPDIGYGVLLYTGSSDAEGTLGGLIQVGRRIHEHVRAALELGRLCSNDPVCAQHNPENPLERRLLHGAACHGCVLIAETSCEQQNEFLDRALVVPTVENLGTEFFDVSTL